MSETTALNTVGHESYLYVSFEHQLYIRCYVLKVLRENKYTQIINLRRIKKCLGNVEMSYF